ncbi:Zinc finger, SWIM-type [Sesbania bispinosa]|nr:Zinc finger, SWIM-type [Sesbania bispinosa]
MEKGFEELSNGDGNSGTNEVCGGVEACEGPKNVTELTVDEIMSLEFDLEEDAFNFDSNYAKVVGFSVRKDDVYHDDWYGIVMRNMVCNRQGERSEKNMQRKDRCREPKAITRTRCQARLRVRLGYLSGKWTVTHFEPNHNHELTPSTYVHLISAYRGLSEGDKAQVNSLHMLCYWHLHQNACENVKIPKFLEEFKTLLYINIGPDEFEMKWSSLVEKYGVSNNRAVKEYRHNELMSDFKTKFSDPVLSTSLYKSEVNNKVRVKINKFGSACFEYVVIYDKDKGVFACDCHLFESCGIPCSHIFCTMKNESIEVIPESLICKRWTKAAKDEFISEISVEENDSSKLDLLRTGAIADACNRLFRATCKYLGNYPVNIDSIDKLTAEIEKKKRSSVKNRNKGSNVIGGK